MANYIDGFVLPIPRSRLDAYRSLVEVVAQIWKEHGALDYREYVSEDQTATGTGSFSEFAGAADDEVIIFGWVAFESRAARDLANERVAADSRMPDLASLSNAGFDAQRMAYAGFSPLVGGS